MNNTNLSNTIKELSKKWLLKKIFLPVEFNNGSTPIFDLLNQSLTNRHNRRELLLPNFSDAKTVAIFSDYGGEAKSSKYYTYTFLFVDSDCAYFFSDGMKKIREKYFSEDIDKEIAFKDWRYGPIRRCIEEYLNFSNNFLNGLVFSLIVEKEITSLITRNNKADQNSLIQIFIENNLGNWNSKTIEKALRILYSITYFSKLLIPAGKKIFWMTDDDSIMPNEKKAEIMAGVLQNCLNSLKYPPKYETLGYSYKPFTYEDDSLHFRDLLSITDVVAGSIEHYLSRKETMEDFTINNLADKTLMWLSGQGVGLKKLNLIIRGKDNGFSAGFVDFRTFSPMENVIYADTRYDVSVSNELFNEI